MKKNILITHLILVSSLVAISSFAKEKPFDLAKAISTNAKGTFSEASSIDFDGDGLPDILASSPEKITWSKNLGKGKFAPKKILHHYINAEGARDIFAVDLDGDGLPEVLSTNTYSDPSNGPSKLLYLFHYHKITWHQNLGKGRLGPEKIIIAKTDYSFSVFAKDLDKDGRPDVLSTSYMDNKIIWYRNLGDGKFSDEKIISTNAHNPRSVFSIDLDGDHLPDVLSASWADGKIVWYKNLGKGKFSDKKILNASASKSNCATSVFAIDLDGDGLPDVLSSFDNNGGKIAWHKNLGKGKFSDEKIISTKAKGVHSLSAIDLDGDGLPEVLSSFNNKSEGIEWYKNLGDGKFNLEKELL